MDAVAGRKKALIVIPAYNESRRLPRLLGDIRRSCARDLDALCELRYLVVDDGSGTQESRSMRVLVETCGDRSLVCLLRLETNLGKGGAIRAGFSRGLAQGFDFLGFIDADGSVSIDDLHRLLRFLLSDFGMGAAGAIASRRPHPGFSVRRGPVRRLVGHAFSWFVCVLFGIAVDDPQCGLKIFRTEPLSRFLDAPSSARWVWDTELLASMLRAGLDVREVPVNWRETPGGKLSFLRDPLAMAAELFYYRWRMCGGPGEGGIRTHEAPCGA